MRSLSVSSVLRVLASVGLVGLLSCGITFSKDKTFRFALGFYSASVAADIHSTHLGLERGARETNPMYNWAEDDQMLVLRAGTGFAIGYGLTRLHRTRPKLAKTLTFVIGTTTFAVAAHNYRVADRARD